MNDLTFDGLQLPDMEQLTPLQALQLQLQLVKIRRDQIDAQVIDLTARVINELDLGTTLFHVVIGDVWDAGAGVHEPTGGADVTRRGLREAIKAAEGDNPRTDNVLSYWVTARTDAGDFSIPEKMWLPFSKQTAKTLRRLR